MGIEHVVIALGLTLLAGLTTGIGGALCLFARRTDTRMLALSMGLSAGVMVYISLVELLPEATESFALSMGKAHASAMAALAFFGGMGLIALIDFLVPEDENPHEIPDSAELQRPDSHRLKRTGTMIALAIGIHNFPEGMATFVAALDGMRIALPIVIAIALHNIPEGIAVFVPIYHSTGSRRRAFRYTFLSGLAEPLGALVGALLLMPFWSPALNATCLAAVAGIMVYISFDELLPGAERHGHHHLAIIGVVAGMAMMAMSLIWL